MLLKYQSTFDYTIGGEVISISEDKLDVIIFNVQDWNDNLIINSADALLLKGKAVTCIKNIIHRVTHKT